MYTYIALIPSSVFVATWKDGTPINILSTHSINSDYSDYNIHLHVIYSMSFNYSSHTYVFITYANVNFDRC